MTGGFLADFASERLYLAEKSPFARLGPWCRYELQKSIDDNKGILGILLPNQDGHGPKWISKYGPVYRWDHEKFPDWVEAAAKKVGR